MQLNSRWLAARLSVLTLFAALCLPTAEAADAPPAAPAPTQAKAHPLTGNWSWTAFKGSCEERYQYRDDGSMVSRSGEAQAQWTYRVSPLPSALGFYKVLETAAGDNGKRDCYGDLGGEAGSERIKFIQLSPSLQRLIACKAESLAACYGPLERTP
jgi:hypothetical protein